MKIVGGIAAALIVGSIITNLGDKETNKPSTEAASKVATTQQENNDNGQQKQSSVPVKEEAPQNKEGINKEEFGKIQNGMSYEEVVAIVGNDGELQSESEVGGYKTQMYMWSGEKGIGSNANVTIQNGKVQAKAQFGLK